MTINPRILGKKVLFKLDGVDYSDDIIELTLEPEEADTDVVTFADAAAGGATDYWLRGSAIQSNASASLHKYLWDNNGETEVPYVLGVEGNAVPSATQPHQTGTVSLGRKPLRGGKADETFVFDFEIKADQEPTDDITA